MMGDIDKESKFLRDFFILRTNLTQVAIKFLEGVEDVVTPFIILRDEGKRFLSLCAEDSEKADIIFEKYKSELLKRYRV